MGRRLQGTCRIRNGDLVIADQVSKAPGDYRKCGAVKAAEGIGGRTHAWP
jgi:hypothetical protein